MSTYTIKAVGDPREWSSQKHGGRFFAYPCDLQDEAGQVHLGVEWSRKADSKAPEVGDTVHGDIQSGQHGDRLKVDWDAMGGGKRSYSASASVSNGRGNWQPDHERDPEKVARIARSHALTTAVAILTRSDAFNAAKPDEKKRAIKDWAAWVQEDVALAATEVSLGAKPLDVSPAANGGGADAQPASPAAAPSGDGTKESDDIPFARPEYGAPFSEREREANRR